MARRSPAPCLVPSVTTSRRETSFSRSCAVAAGAVVAPALRPGFRRIVENPAAIGIGADFDALHVVVRQHFSKRSGNPGDHPIPIAPHRSRLGADSILVLY